MEDKRYRECMAEIAATLKKYDMAGAVTVISKERAMFRYQFPTWGCISQEGGALRFRAKAADYPTKEDHHKALELSAHIICQMRDIAVQTLALCQNIIGSLAEHGIEIEHKPYADFDPEREN